MLSPELLARLKARKSGNTKANAKKPAAEGLRREKNEELKYEKKEQEKIEEAGLAGNGDLVVTERILNVQYREEQEEKAVEDKTRWMTDVDTDNKGTYNNSGGASNGEQKESMIKKLSEWDNWRVNFNGVPITSDQIIPAHKGWRRSINCVWLIDTRSYRKGLITHHSTTTTRPAPPWD